MVWLLAALVCLVSATSWAMPLGKYLTLRTELEAADYPISAVAASPAQFHGKVIELRGTVSGSASDGETARIILSSGSEHYILVCDEPSRTPPGHSAIAALVVIGEGSTVCLSDLRLVDWCYEAEIQARKTQAAEQAKAQQQSAKKPAAATAKRNQQPTSRGSSYRDILPAYRKAISSFNPRLSKRQAEDIADAILRLGLKHDVDPRLVVAIVLAESHFRPEATSPKGAMGLGQLMPGTARGLGVRNAYDPEDNLAGAIKLIRGHLNKLSGKAPYHELTWDELKLALAFYNAGAGAVRKYGGIPPYRETQNYVRRVVKYYKRLCGIGEG